MNCLYLSKVCMFLIPLLFISGCSEPPEDASKVPEGLNAAIGRTGKKQQPFSIFTHEGKSLFLGNQTGTSAKLSIRIQNKTAYRLDISAWRSPCPCIEVIEAPEAFAPGETASLVVVVHPENYAGRIRKVFPVTFGIRGKTETVFLPLEFYSGMEPAEEKMQKEMNPEIQYIDYIGGTMEDKRYSGSAAWIFSGSGCTECNEVKANVFPSIFPRGTRIVQVNLDDKEALLLLLSLEKRLNVEKPGNSPVLYYQNRLFYGAEPIRNLLQK